jgi:hypothetical protein
MSVGVPSRGKAIELDAADAMLFVMRGKLYKQAGDDVRSVGNFFAALELGHASKEVVAELRRSGFNVDAFLPQFQRKQ